MTREDTLNGVEAIIGKGELKSEAPAAEPTAAPQQSAATAQPEVK
jgi:hypothetical protein